MEQVDESIEIFLWFKFFTIIIKSISLIFFNECLSIKDPTKVALIIFLSRLNLENISFTNFIAIFSDSNNSKQKIIAYYRDIYFSSE